ncbi:uncharacterized protein LOC125551862 isoform X1 [Triticum urartu]|uniref:uncharacterized protein LOC125551862 isoform X1 n=1 Tax=Triticum urartu TaxID=4572 RepID=UPI002044A377|nr:uncharacterized protein LOC125551862 isoform X1 [Triticum urartu]XP_048571191.1 uncharacterized protein LOC125551862 isoform X1 [Triticum urartu]XP_048571192.1 uncharacterized protein LOC125551862 isoform X1 [Triticum urartu]
MKFHIHESPLIWLRPTTDDTSLLPCSYEGNRRPAPPTVNNAFGFWVISQWFLNVFLKFITKLIDFVYYLLGFLRSHLSPFMVSGEEGYIPNYVEIIKGVKLLLRSVGTMRSLRGIELLPKDILTSLLIYSNHRLTIFIVRISFFISCWIIDLGICRAIYHRRMYSQNTISVIVLFYTSVQSNGICILYCTAIL